MRKPLICICDNKGADQLRSNCEADQHLCFRYLDRTIPTYTQNFKPLACFCDFTARFVLDLVGTPDCCFPRAKAFIISCSFRYIEQQGGSREDTCIPATREMFGTTASGSGNSYQKIDQSRNSWH